MQNPTTTPQEFVYVIHAIGTNRIKLGFSTKPKERLAGLQTAAPYPLQILACWPGSRAREDRLHRYMAQFRKVGEWFEVPPFCGLKLWELATKSHLKSRDCRNFPPVNSGHILSGSSRAINRKNYANASPAKRRQSNE